MVSGERLPHNVHGRNRESTGEIMKVSTKGRYALRIMIDLAEHNTGGYIRLKIFKATGDYTEIYGADHADPHEIRICKELSWK